MHLRLRFGHGAATQGWFRGESLDAYAAMGYVSGMNTPPHDTRSKQTPAVQGASAKEQRRAREKAALMANMARRKAQARGRSGASPAGPNTAQGRNDLPQDDTK